MKTFILFLFLQLGMLSATEFTISSYNCGGLSEHYDYLRAASMEKLMQERYNAEPQQMALNEKIQKIALKILFAPNSYERSLAEQEWNQNGYQKIFEDLTNNYQKWNRKSEQIITSYKVRPVIINDEKVNDLLEDHLNNLTSNSQGTRLEKLQLARQIMAKRIFAHHVQYDIICLQEADYLDDSLFPVRYEVLFSDTDHSRNGIAWNKDRFEFVKSFGSIMDRALAIQLRDKETGKTILVASGHLTGCNPYKFEQYDSEKGDRELQAITDLFQSQNADIKIIGMDSNVTALHPRLNILKDAGYQLDSENYLEQTCTNSYLVLNTRIDWIAFDSHLPDVTITNIPVLSVGLNNIQTNISDHKPIAAKISY